MKTQFQTLVLKISSIQIQIFMIFDIYSHLSFIYLNESFDILIDHQINNYAKYYDKLYYLFVLNHIEKDYV